MCESNIKSRNNSNTLFVRIPEVLNLRLDAEIVRQRYRTGRRVSRAALLEQILDQFLPPLPDIAVEAAGQ